jgi:hypothetical protein
MIEQEKWLTISVATNYEVSNLGNIRNKETGRVLKPYRSNSGTGYFMVDLIDYSGGKRKKIKSLIHRLVAFAFLPLISGKDDINHKDGNKIENNKDNLEWVTHSENMKHAFDMGLNHKGSKHGISKLSEKEVCEIKTLLINKTKRSHPYYSEIAARYNVDRKTVESIHRQKTWKEVKSG